MPAYTVGLAARAVGGDLSGKRVVVLGAAYRGGAKETAFSGVFAAVDELVARGAVVLVHDPLYTDEELARHGWAPYHFGEPVDVAIVHTDHTEYAALTAADFPRLAVLVDGRARIDPARFPGVRVVTVGKPDQLATEG
jgi:UDP-N-acetyl-D-mannosaminuronate dehydrogenase